MSEPFFDETFWVIYQTFDGTMDFSLRDIFHYNSLTHDMYLRINDMTPENCQLAFIPERLIVGLDEKSKQAIIGIKDHIVNNKIPFISNTDINVWTLNPLKVKLLEMLYDIRLQSTQGI